MSKESEEKKRGGGKGKWIVIIVVIAVIVIAFAVSGGEDEDVPKKVSTTSKDDIAKKKDLKGTDKESEGKKEEVKNDFYPGDILETENLRISYVSAENYKSDNEFIQPKDGNKYIKLDFEFENITDSDQLVSSYDFTCYADGYDAEQSYLDGADLDATLSADKKTKGAVFFEVPTDAKDVTVEYETDYWSGEKIIFHFKK